MQRITLASMNKSLSMTHCGCRFQAAIVAKTYDNLVRELDALDNGVQVLANCAYGLAIPCDHSMLT